MSEGRAAMWTMIGVAVGFKTWGMILIFKNDSTRATLEWMLLMNWPFYLPLILLGAPLVWWWRMVRVRRKRARLIHEEWHVDGERTAKR